MHPQTGTFYVYRLIDPRCGRAFYVGKGQRDRAWQHQQDVVQGRKYSNAAKCQRIAEIVGFGLDVQIEIVAQYDDELDALDHEFRLVDADPTLTNVQPGGVGRIMSPSVIRWLRERRVAKVLAERERRKAEFKASQLRRRQESLKQFVAVAEGGRSEAEVKAWVEEQAAALASPAERAPRVRNRVRRSRPPPEPAVVKQMMARADKPKPTGKNRRARRKRSEIRKARAVLRSVAQVAQVAKVEPVVSSKPSPPPEPKTKPWWHKCIPGRQRLVGYMVEET